MGRKVPKAVVRRMIESGRYQVSIHGTSCTDWKRLFEDLPEDAVTVEGHGWPDGDGIPLPQTNMVVPKGPELPVPAPCEAAESQYEIINGKKYRTRQLEHFGDSVVGLAARMMVYDLCSADLRMYFHYTGRLITNKNLGMGIASRGTTAEINIGRVWAEKGLEAAIQAAKDLLAETAAWKTLLEWKEKEKNWKY